MSGDPGPGRYVVTFERIGAHRPAPLTVTIVEPVELEDAIRTYAEFYARTKELTVCVDPLVPGRSVGAGWVSAGGRDAGSFTWRPKPTSGIVVDMADTHTPDTRPTDDTTEWPHMHRGVCSCGWESDLITTSPLDAHADANRHAVAAQAAA